MRSPILAVSAAVFLILVLILSSLPSYRIEPTVLPALGSDDYFMTMALVEIGKMNPQDGWPVGAVVVRDDKIIGRGSNQLFATNNPTQHAEYIAVDQAIRWVKHQHPQERYDDFFEDATVYVTLEPCAMDAGKITLARFKKVVMCDFDEDWGSFGSVNNSKGYPHEVEVVLSDLPICQKLRGQHGWNTDELWEMGRKYAAATGQVPSLLQVVLKKLKYELKALIIS